MTEFEPTDTRPLGVRRWLELAGGGGVIAREEAPVAVESTPRERKLRPRPLLMAEAQ